MSNTEYQNLSPRDRIIKAHISIMRSKEFCMFAGVLSVGDVLVADTHRGNPVKTACTDGRDVTYNPEFVDSLSHKQLVFVVLHETIHKVYQHMKLWRNLFKENPQLANQAADYIVNDAIVIADPNHNVASFPTSVPPLWDVKYRGMSTKQVFDKLKQSNPQGNTLDDHDWEGAEEMSKEVADATEKAIDQAIRQGEMIRSKNNGNKSDLATEFTKPKVNWREQLREFVKSVCATKDLTSWRKPSRRFLSQDIYMPSMIGESINSLVVAVDTSGSIGSKELKAFLSEVMGVCNEVNPSTLELLYWGSEVVRHETYTIGQYDTLTQTTKPASGGGTTVGCVREYIQDKKIIPEAIIILTDGFVESDWGGTWSHPTLWAITSDEVSPHGKSIHIKENEYA